MGQDKSTLQVGGRSMLELALDVLNGVAPRVVLATGTGKRHGELGLEMICDQRADAGPLAGIEACLAALDAEWLVFAPCDVPDLSVDHYARLLERGQRDDLDLCLLGTPGGAEPLCAAIRRTCLPAVREALDRGERRVDAFHAHRGARGPLRIGVVEIDGLRNVNTPADLEGARQGDGESAATGGCGR